MKKRARRSKTIHFNTLLMGISLWPKAQRWISTHPSETLIVVSAANIFLRMFTRYEIELPTLNFKKGK